jgi:cell division protein FtsI (penicillin-binding protein 3)
LYARNLPRDEVGYRADFSQIMDYLQLPLYAQGKSEMGLLTAHADSLLLQPRRMPERVAPNVVGMGLRDAVYALENRGFKVRSTGVGKVARQSIMPGTRSRGQTVVLYLN